LRCYIESRVGEGLTAASIAAFTLHPQGARMNPLRSLLLLACLGAAVRADDDPVFSGPQVGEKIVPFKVQGVYDDLAGKEIDFVTAAEGKPTLLIFVHELTRPSLGMTRALTDYAAGRAKDGLATGIVWLAADKSEAEQYLKRARQSLNLKAPVGISVDGIEGPGSYGLNRKVALTILVAKDNKVTANFALVQPSLTEAPAVLGEVVKLIGGKAPTLADLAPPQRAGEPDGRLRELLRAVIQRTASPEEVKKAAEAVEQYVGEDKARRQDLGGIAKRVVEGGKLSDYGTPAAQDILRGWAEKYGR
jgi:hypothetical protein